MPDYTQFSLEREGMKTSLSLSLSLSSEQIQKRSERCGDFSAPYSLVRGVKGAGQFPAFTQT